jgi:hypothetical protein
MTQKMKQLKHPIRVAVDFDGVICDFKEGYKAPGTFGLLIPGAKDGLEILHLLGYYIIVYSCRGETDLIKKFLDENDVYYDVVNEHTVDTNPKFIQNPNKVVADIYLDDRAIRFHGSWEDTVNEIESFKPWYWDGKKPSSIGGRAKNEDGGMEAAAYLRYNVLSFLDMIVNRQCTNLDEDDAAKMSEAIMDIVLWLENEE